MGGYSSFVDRFRVFQRLTAGPRAVTATRQVVAALFGSADASDHVQIALPVIRSLPDDLLCSHDILSNALPMCAEGNDPQLLRRLWDIGAAGLKDSKLGWPGLQHLGTHNRHRMHLDHRSQWHVALAEWVTQGLQQQAQRGIHPL